MHTIIGIDCSTQPKKTGLALATFNEGIATLHTATIGSVRYPPVDIINEWIPKSGKVLLALDSPLGWPIGLCRSLTHHQAGDPIAAEPDRMFHRKTDDEMQRRFEKRPFEVGANLIARTAHAALVLLEKLRQQLGHPIPLAWSPKDRQRILAIEVYPAATRLAHHAPSGAGSLRGLTGLFQSPQRFKNYKSPDAKDAIVCALAGIDFLNGLSDPPDEHDIRIAKKEGWIWVLGDQRK